ncbi:MAG: major capsid protein [Phage AS32]|nr:MAG: major capsid protein [Phage AS32]
MNQLFSKTLQSFINATDVGQDRIIRKEVSLGQIREIEPPDTHLGLGFAPWLEVATDDVIFHYIKGDTDGLAPARAEDAESELAQKDESVLGEGRASVIDWSLKDHYDASDVTRYREFLRIMQSMQDGSLPLTVGSMLEDWATKYARDAARRRRKLDNRINWLIMSSIATGQIAYDDGKIKFAVDWGRPTSQTASHADNDIASHVTDGVVDWSGTTHDPIGFIEAVQEYMYDTYGVRMNRILTSKKAVRRIVNSDKFAQRAGLGAAYNGSNQPVQPDLNYLLDGWGPDAARQVVENATGVQFIIDDSVYRTRAVGSKTVVNNRFFPENLMVFLPNLDDVNEVDDTQIGFAKTLTSPHPEGNFTPGFYEWERQTVDPWGQDAGTGVKAFPVFPHMDYTYAVTVTL